MGHPFLLRVWNLAWAWVGTKAGTLMESNPKIGLKARLRTAQSSFTFLLAIVFYMLPREAQAFRTGRDLRELKGAEKVRFAKPARFHLNGPPPPDIPSESVEAAIAGALQLITQVDCARVDIAYAGRTAEAAHEHDGFNSISFVSNWSERGFDPTAPGTTDVGYLKTKDGWEIEEADVYLNANFAWSDAPASTGAKDLKYTITHEVLHGLGLLHSCEPGGGVDGAPDCATSKEFEKTLMHPISQQREPALGDDDVAGLCFLYSPDDPASRQPPVVVPECSGIGCACNADEECASLLGCEAGHCEHGKGQVGDPCEGERDCQGTYCTSEGYCTDGCSSALDCARGQECSGSICVGLQPFGATCKDGSDCMAGALCLRDSLSKGEPVCTRECSQSECPLGWSCGTAEGKQVCTPLISVKSAGGCSFARIPMRSHFLWGLLIALMGCVYMRRRWRATMTSVGT